MAIPKNTNRIPSICRLQYIFKEEIQTMNTSTSEYHKWVTLRTGLSWREIYFTAGSAEFTEVQKQEDAGPVFNQQLKFLFPGEDDNNTSDFDGMITRPVVIAISYSDGNIKLLGSILVPARISKSHKADSKYTGQEFTALCSDSKQAFWLKEVES